MVPLPSCSVLFLLSPSSVPSPSPGQADAIGASSLRDPVPYSSSVYLLCLTPLSISPHWTLRVRTGQVMDTSLLTQLKRLSLTRPLGYPGKDEERTIQLFSNPMPIDSPIILKVHVP